MEMDLQPGYRYPWEIEEDRKKEAESVQNRIDANRYRWIRDNHPGSRIGIADWTDNELEPQCLGGQDADMAIDLEMTGGIKP